MLFFLSAVLLFALDNCINKIFTIYIAFTPYHHNISSNYVEIKVTSTMQQNSKRNMGKQNAQIETP